MREYQVASRSGFDSRSSEARSAVTDDFRPTLSAGFGNLVAKKDSAVSLVGVHGFDEFLVPFPASWRFFADRQARLHRLLLVKE
jgi:hypothetical protein